MKTILRISLSILCGLCISTEAGAAAKELTLDRIVAIVNDVPVTQTELNDAMNTVKKQMESSGTALPPNDVLRKQVLQQLIDRKLQLQLADQAGLHIDDAEVTKAINHIAEENHMTPSQLYDQVKQQGLSEDEYRKEIREEILLQQVQQHEVGAKISITPQEVKDFTQSKSWQVYNNKEYHLEDIVIALPDSPTSQQIQDGKKQAQALLDKIHRGENFRAAAAAESSGNKALQGGDLGWRKLPEIPSAFADQVIHMQVNDIAGPIQTPNGFHLIRLAGVRDTGTPKPSDKEIEQLLYQRKMEEQIQSWVSKLRSQAYINLNPEN